jgi:hypothetical protein
MNRRRNGGGRHFDAGRGIALLMVVLALAATRVQAQNARGIDLPGCITLYENGEYQAAADSLKMLLPKLSAKDQADAYKYLAFSYVMLDMISKARENFAQMLTDYPNAQIDTVMVPPNITVVFNQVKTERELVAQQKEVAAKGIEDLQHKRRSRLAWGAVTGAVAVGSACAAVVLFVKGQDTYDQYQKSQDPDKVASLEDQTRSQYVAGYVLSGVGGVALVASAVTFILVPPKAPKAALQVGVNSIRFSYAF